MVFVSKNIRKEIQPHIFGVYNGGCCAEDKKNNPESSAKKENDENK